MTVKTLKCCSICDLFYDKSDTEQLNRHIHPEPQSGLFRLAFLNSGMPYEQWVEETRTGQIWDSRTIR